MSRLTDEQKAYLVIVVVLLLVSLLSFCVVVAIGAFVVKLVMGL